MKIAPCKGCDKRFSGCHSSCESYIQWRKELDARNSELYRENDIKEYERAVSSRAERIFFNKR